jgi:hypothetical protein
MSGVPKFLLADDMEMSRVFVVHTEPPRFIAEVLVRSDDTLLDPHWFDDAPIDGPGLRELMSQATQFYQRCLEQTPDEQN